MSNPDEEAHAAAVRVALSMYVGERCKFCRHRFTSLADLDARSVVFAGYHEHGRIACQACWDAQAPAYPVEDTP